MYDFSVFKKEAAAASEWLKKEYGGFNTGRASASVLDSVMVESYGSRVQISHVAAISAEDPRTLRISPWDKSQIKEIEKAIVSSNLGLSVSIDDMGLRVSFPQLTTERRISLIKLLKEKLEEARVSVRGERDKAWHDIQEKERAGKMSEDEKFRAKEELQKIIDETNKSLESVFEKKEREVMGE